MAAFAVFARSEIFMEGMVSVLARIKGWTLAAKGTRTGGAVDHLSDGGSSYIFIDLCLALPMREQIAEHTKGGICKFIVLADRNTADDAIQVLNSGASALLTHDCGEDEIQRALAAVAAGDVYITSQLSTQIIEALQRAQASRRQTTTMRLTHREEQIAKMLLVGKKNKEIAAHLAISEKTVKSYVTSLLQKFNARSRLEIVVNLHSSGMFSGFERTSRNVGVGSAPIRM